MTDADTVATQSSGAVPTPNQLRFGEYGAGSPMAGTIKKLAFYPQRISNAQLQALTS